MKEAQFCTKCKVKQIGAFTSPPLCTSCADREQRIVRQLGRVKKPTAAPAPEPDIDKRTLNGPCRYCSQLTTAPSLAELFYGPACKEYDERRKAARVVEVEPGHDYYEPTTDVQRGLHSKAIHKRIR